MGTLTDYQQAMEYTSTLWNKYPAAYDKTAIYYRDAFSSNMRSISKIRYKLPKFMRRTRNLLERLYEQELGLFRAVPQYCDPDRVEERVAKIVSIQSYSNYELEKVFGGPITKDPEPLKHYVRVCFDDDTEIVYKIGEVKWKT